LNLSRTVSKSYTGPHQTKHAMTLKPKKAEESLLNKKEGFAGDISTLRGVQIPPPAL